MSTNFLGRAGENTSREDVSGQDKNESSASRRGSKATPHDAPQTPKAGATRGKTEADEKEQDQYYLSGLFNIEASPAFKNLEMIRVAKEVPDEKIQYLKDKFLKLHQFLLSINDFEKSLGKKLKQAIQDVTMQRLEKDRAISKQFTGNFEIGELKRELLKAQNEVNLALERESRLHAEIEDVGKQKQDLIHDIEEIRRHKADMLEPQLIQATKELKMDLLQRRHQVENLQKDMEEKRATYDVVLHEKDRLEAEREKHLLALTKASETPIKICKQIDILKDAISALSVENMKQATLAQSLDKELERLARKKRDLDELKANQAADYEVRRGLIHEMERQVDDIFKEHELAKEQLTFQKAEKVRLELASKRIIHEIRREHDLVLRVIREKDAYLKLHRRLQTTVNNIKMSTPTIQKQISDMKRQLEQVKNDEKFYRKEVARLRRIIDQYTYDYVKIDRVEKGESSKLEAQVEANRRLSADLDSVATEFHELQRDVESVKVEKDQRAREVIRIQSKVRAVKGENAARDIAIIDASKRCSESQNRLREFGTLYELVKNERNKYLNQIQSSTQRAAEMREKNKILSNELEILRHEIYTKDREVAKRKQENTAAYGARDASKNEANKLMSQYRDKRDQIEQHLTNIEALNNQISRAEEQMANLKKRYEWGTKERNSVGLQLLDRDDELCILYERLNIQKEVMKQGEMSLADRDEEIRKLSLVVAELERKAELQKRLEPNIYEHIKKAEELEKGLDSLRGRSNQLSVQMENPDDPDRCRNLAGKDPTQDDLLKKIDRLEGILATREEKLLEKDLLLEEITTLSNRIKNQTLENKDESYEMTKKLNDLTKKLKVVTRKMMSKVSELAMNQALAMSLYQEKCEKEAVLSEAEEQYKNGQIPFAEIEKDFLRIEKARQKREMEIRALQERKEKEASGRFVDLDEDNYYIYGNTRTKAEPRPNAYIPEASTFGELPIPKPYGGHAPFKPQDPGAQMRHFRKPLHKPIEI